MEALAELQKLSLISILCKELENHHIPADQDLAEVFSFICHILLFLNSF